MHPNDQCSTVYEARPGSNLMSIDRDGTYIYKEYYSAFKKNDIMPFAATWMDPETVTLSEVSQAEKHCIVLHCIVLHPFYAESEKTGYK